MTADKHHLLQFHAERDLRMFESCDLQVSLGCDKHKHLLVVTISPSGYSWGEKDLGVFLYRKSLFPELEERHVAKLAVLKGRSQLAHSHSCLRQSFPSVAGRGAAAGTAGSLSGSSPAPKGLGTLAACFSCSVFAAYYTK